MSNKNAPQGYNQEGQSVRFDKSNFAPMPQKRQLLHCQDCKFFTIPITRKRSFCHLTGNKARRQDLACELVEQEGRE